MEKYGFVYIWYDCKRKMYYIGSHWGTEDDGYICSSRRMNAAYKRRPDDFKRRILENTNNRKKLYEQEFKWLQKAEKKKERYYNLHFAFKEHWHLNEYTKLTVVEKMKISLNKTLKNMSEEERKLKFGKCKGKISKRKGLTLEQEYGKEKAEEIRNKIKEKRALQINTNSASMKGRPSPKKGKKLELPKQSRINMGWSKGMKLGNRLSEEAKLNIGKKNSENLKKLWQDPLYREKMLKKRSNSKSQKIS